MARPIYEDRTRRSRSFLAALIWGLALGCSEFARAGSVVEIGGSSTSRIDRHAWYRGHGESSISDPLTAAGTLLTALNNANSVNGGFAWPHESQIDSGGPSASAALASALHPFAIGGDRGLKVATHDDPAGNRTGTRAIHIVDGDAGKHSALDFLTGGAFDFNFLVRFKGFEDAGSENVGASVVPLPPAFALGVFGFGIAALAAGLKRRASAKRPE